MKNQIQINAHLWLIVLYFLVPFNNHFVSRLALQVTPSFQQWIKVFRTETCEEASVHASFLVSEEEENEDKRGVALLTL